MSLCDGGLSLGPSEIEITRIMGEQLCTAQGAAALPPSRSVSRTPSLHSGIDTVEAPRYGTAEEAPVHENLKASLSRARKEHTRDIRRTTIDPRAHWIVCGTRGEPSAPTDTRTTQTQH